MGDGDEVTEFIEGVAVTIPSGMVRQGVRAVRLPPEAGAGFWPFRLVANIALERAGEYLLEFPEPIELRVRYYRSDVEMARLLGKPLRLGFWDGTQWVPFSEDKHRFRLQSDPTDPASGVGIVQLSRWGDPSVAWGT